MAPVASRRLGSIVTLRKTSMLLVALVIKPLRQTEQVPLLGSNPLFTFTSVEEEIAEPFQRACGLKFEVYSGFRERRSYLK